MINNQKSRYVIYQVSRGGKVIGKIKERKGPESDGGKISEENTITLPFVLP